MLCITNTYCDVSVLFGAVISFLFLEKTNKSIVVTNYFTNSLNVVHLCWKIVMALKHSRNATSNGHCLYQSQDDTEHRHCHLLAARLAESQSINVLGSNNSPGSISVPSSATHLTQRLGQLDQKGCICPSKSTYNLEEIPQIQTDCHCHQEHPVVLRKVSV